MRKFSKAIILFCAIVFPISSYAAPIKNFNPFGLSSNTQKTLLGAIHQLFEEHFQEADRLLAQIESTKEEHPVIALVGVVRYWWEMSVNILEIRDEASKPFLTAADACLELAKKRIEKGDETGEAVFTMGVTLGLMSRYSAANHAWLAAYTRGSKAAEYSKKALEINPNLRDAYLPLGTFNYAKSVIQGSLIEEGDKSVEVDKDNPNGLAQLRDAYVNGIYFKHAAGLLLAGILLDDDPEKALILLSELKRTIPKSGFVPVVYITALFNAGQDKKMDSEAKVFLAKINSGVFSKKYLPQAHFLKGLVVFKKKDWKTAATQFDLAIKSGTPDNAYVTWSHLYLGYTFDLLAQRDDAKKEYEQVLHLERRFASHEHAKSRLDKPFQESDIELKKVAL